MMNRCSMLRFLTLAALLSIPGRGAAQPEAVEAMKVRYQYAVKIVCGRPPAAGDNAGILAPGTYYTAVNVHNPGKGVAFRKKVAVALPWQKPGPVTKFVEGKLGPDQAMEVDCPEIIRMTNGSPDKPVKGFLVFESWEELDIVAVYTAANPQGVSTMTLERVPRRELGR